MYYGRVTYDGRISEAFAHSGNFSVKMQGDGIYEITLREWTRDRPIFCVTNSPRDNHQADYTSTCTVKPSDAGGWVAEVRTYSARGSLASKSFTFMSRTGQSREIVAPQTLLVDPSVVNFGSGEVLALSTTVDGVTIHLDKGSVLTAIGRSMKLKLSKKTVGGWSLSGWTYDGNSVQGQGWDNDDDDLPCFQMQTNPEQYGPGTTYGTFAIMGTKDGPPKQYISSDPVVRLASVPPGRLPVP